MGANDEILGPTCAELVSNTRRWGDPSPRPLGLWTVGRLWARRGLSSFGKLSFDEVLGAKHVPGVQLKRKHGHLRRAAGIRWRQQVTWLMNGEERTEKRFMGTFIIKKTILAAAHACSPVGSRRESTLFPYFRCRRAAVAPLQASVRAPRHGTQH